MSQANHSCKRIPLQSKLFGLTLLLLGASAALAADPPLPRTVLAFYDSKEEEQEIIFTSIHQMAEMPLNHLGMVVRYRDIHDGLPAIEEMDDVRGVLTWFYSNAMPNPEAFLSWAGAVVDAGKRFVILGLVGVDEDLQNRLTPLMSINRFLAKLGLRNESDWHHIIYDLETVFKDSRMVEFERRLDGVLPPYEEVKTIDPLAKSYLVVRRGPDPMRDSHLVVIGPHGGYAAAGYTHYSTEGSSHVEWCTSSDNVGHRA